MLVLLLSVPIAATAAKIELKCPNVTMKNDFAKFTSTGGGGWSGKASHQITLGCSTDIRNNEMVCYHKLGGMGPTMYRSTMKIPPETKCVKSRYACRFDCYKQEVMEQQAPKVKRPPSLRK